MPIVLGLASSHAPSMFAPAESWPQIHKGLTRDVPQPLKLKDETPEVIAGYVERIKKGFSTIRQKLDKAKIDVVVIVGDDQTEVFNNSGIPALGVFTGKEVKGTTSISWLGERFEDNHITLKNDPEIAHLILNELVDRGFDATHSEILTPLGRPAGGIGHAFSRIARALSLVDRGTPMVPIFLNGYHAPLPTGQRCYDLGLALRDILKSRPERIAIYGSGGMSHWPGGPRAGWVDEPLDRWILRQIESGRTERLTNLFTFDSDTMRGGTGELRSWITVAGASEGLKGEVIDYIPAVHAVTGLGFVSWSRD